MQSEIIVDLIPKKAKENCPIPTCDAKLTILDQWRVSIGKRGTRFRFGKLLKIDLPESSGEEGWSVAIKLPCLLYTSPSPRDRG